MLVSIKVKEDSKYFIQDFVNLVYKRQHIIESMTYLREVNLFTVDIVSEGSFDTEALLDKLSDCIFVEEIMKH